MTTPCRDRSHSPRLSSGRWTCPDCEAGTKPSPLARAIAALEFRASESEWSTFVTALKAATGPGGFITQTKVRPLIQSIPHKHRGQLYRRAVAQGLIKPNGYEPSTDVAGRNSDKPQRTYVWSDAA